jgi:SNF2 family DNA or RNA helicase
LKREGLLLRRTKEQVLKELPPKRRVVQTVDFDTGKYGSLIQSAVEKAKGIEGITDFLQKGRVTREIVEDSRQAIGIAKAPYVAAFVKMLLEAGEKVLLFAYHHAVHDIYTEELKEFRPMRITGHETSAEKEKSVEAFMDGRTNIIIISLRAGSGLNLQKANCVVFGELDWSPAVHSQCEDRAHRIGQEDSILCYYLVAEEGTDETIQEFLGLKVSQFVGIMGDKAETEEDKMLAQGKATEHMNKIVERLKGEKKSV